MIRLAEFKPGDEALGTCEGSFAEYACLRENQGAPRPMNLSFEQAAAAPISACTTLQGLRETGTVGAGAPGPVDRR